MKRYSAGARFYDVLSGERLVYRAGRVLGVQMLGLQPGDTVLDLGCGTGLNFELLVDAVGPGGRVVGLDRSADMLGMARSRIAARGWRNVQVVEADATAFDPESIARIAGTPIDAAFATYSLSVIGGLSGDWRPAWDRMRRSVRPGGRATIVDMALPRGKGRLLSPIVRMVCAAGGADLNAHPWVALAREASDPVHRELTFGHIHAVAGTLASPIH